MSSTTTEFPLPKVSRLVLPDHDLTKGECHGLTGSPSALSEEDSKGGRDGSRGGRGSS